MLVDPASSTLLSNLTVNTTYQNLSANFWGTTVNNEVRMFRGESDAVNATPVVTLVWPGAMAGEDYDPFTNTHYDTYSGSGKTALTSEAQFVTMCKAIHCRAIMQVPAEIDNASFAEKIVNYTEQNLSFVPAYWMIGNEPELWGHWQVPWSKWGYDYTTGPTPTQFGNEVVTYVNAIRQVDNTTPILGLPASGCTCGYWTFAQWIYGVLKVTGNKIQAVAFHEYPAGWLGTGDGSLLDFYITLQSQAGIPVRMLAARQAVQSACPGCNVSVFISELGAALSWSTYGPYAIGFSGALSIASQLTQAMDDNLTNVDLFATELNTTNSWFNPHGNPRPDYALYTQILGHLGNLAYATNFSNVGLSVYGVDTIAPADHSRHDLLVMNDNVTHPVAFHPQFAGSPISGPVEAWYWNGSIHHTPSNGTDWVEPYTPNPVPVAYPDGLPASFVLPPQSLVLFESYPSGGSYVQITPSGAPAGIPWYANVSGRVYGTSGSNISLFLARGSYPISSIPIPLPIGGKEITPVERLAPTVASPLVVSGAYTNATVAYAPQWRLNVFADPGAGGNVTPNAGWVDQGSPVTLTASAAPGYAFVRWAGWGPGSLGGPSRSITVDPTGPVVERARFVEGVPVELYETGLPQGTPWSVTVRGITTTSTDVITLYTPNGTWAYQVSPIPGYRVAPWNGSFTVNGAWGLVHVTFVPLSPLPLAFPVSFRVTGLPSNLSVPISVRGATQVLNGSGASFSLLNGTYAYEVGYVPGYHPDVPLKLFTVGGAPLTVNVSFVPTVYRAVWEANGTRAGTNWSVTVDGTTIRTSSAWATLDLPNGTYPYTVAVPANFSATPANGFLVINGTAPPEFLAFGLLTFPTWFEVSGGPGPAGWSIRFGNVTQSASAARLSFLAPNGSYTFDVHAPLGYYAVPSHGQHTVAGFGTPVRIEFHPSSLKPSAALVEALSVGALTVSMWIGISVAAGFVGVRWLRRRSV